MSDHLERELESELHRVLDPLSARPIPARRAARPATYVQRLVGSTGAALALKVATGLAVAAAATTVAGAATTGSLNPTNWGQHVSSSVETCKQQLRESGQQGIGDCVSDIAGAHGSATAGSKRHHGTGTGSDQGSGSSSGPGQDRDKGKDHNQPQSR